VVAVTVCGTLGSLLDSLLGGSLQASVVDKRSGKVVEGSGGGKVLVQTGPTTSSAATGSDARKYNSDIHATESVANAVNGRAIRTGSAAAKVVSAEDGAHGSRKIESGYDILDNNAVNVLMAALMSVGAMAFASYYWNIPLNVAEVFA
jgi:hypothetical protein